MRSLLLLPCLALLAITALPGDVSGGADAIVWPSGLEPTSVGNSTGVAAEESASASGAVSPTALDIPIEFLNGFLPFRLPISSTPDPPEYLEFTAPRMSRGSRERIRHIIEVELARYPAGTLEGVLRHVLVVGTLSQTGRKGGGAYFLGMVFIAVGNQDDGRRTDQHVVQILHHEISSLLLERHPGRFDRNRFRAALPPGFVYEYEREGVETIPPWRRGEDEASLGFLEVGFLKPWAMRDLEQDFNSYAAELFVRPPRLLRLFAADSLVVRKATVVRDFYLAIDPRFEAVFKGEGSPYLYPPK